MNRFLNLAAVVALGLVFPSLSLAQNTSPSCPAPSKAAMESCQSITHNQLPKPALELLRIMKCDAGSNYDYGAEVHLSADPQDSSYVICCHDAPHGPCGAVLIGKISGVWKDLTPRNGLFGYDMPCAGLVVLEGTHAKWRDLCLPDECASPVVGRCEPPVLQFNGMRYLWPRSTASSRPK